MNKEFFTEKQKGIVKMLRSGELHRINILYGSVRSGKTWITLIVFSLWVATLPKDKTFLMCAKTLTSLKRNCLDLLQDLIGADNFKYSLSAKTGVLFGHKVYLEGANDARSESKIRGMTLQGAYVDEITLIERDFFAMLLSRLSEKDAKLFGSTNPDSPTHWLKKEYIDRENELDIYVEQFAIDDNTFLDAEYVKQIKNEYTGVFYSRFVLGEFAVAEGLVYDFGEDNITDEIPEHGEYYMSIDYGTQNPFSCGLWCIVGDHATRIAEYYYCGRNEQTQKTDEEYCDEVERLAKGYKIKRVIVDPSAASFIVALRKRGFYVTKANNDVLDGIRRVSGYLKDGRLKIHRSCGHTIEEFGLYRWDDKSGEDKVVKENDHCVDGDTLIDTLTGKRKISDLVGKSGFVWSYNERTKRKCIRWFSRVRKTGVNKPLLLITLENGKTLKCTPEHLILTDKGWLEAQYLNEKTKVVDIFAGIARAASVVRIDNADVYNMEVSGTHCFSVNGGIIIHNCMDETRYLVNTVLRHKSSKTDNTFWKEW